jgi:3-oxoacyl-[acyl-carrier protein] reductase
MTSPYPSDLLAGRTAIVTGSTKGIGLGIAEALLDHGCDVVVSSRTESDVRDTVERLNERGGGKAVGRACDVRSHEDVRALIDYAVDELGHLDVLINNAGLGYFGSVEELSVEHWDQVIETNLNGVFYACHESIPHLKKSDDAWIINIASLAGKNPFAGGAAYNASKFGLVGFSEALMMDVRHDGIRVNYIMPGSVSSYFGGGEPGDGDDWKIQPEDLGKMVLDLLAYPQRTLASRIEVRPSMPPRK